MENEIYKFTNGTVINLKSIIAISPLEKNEHNQYILPIYCSGQQKPILIILGYSQGTIDEVKRWSILQNVALFINAWENYLITSKH